MKGRIFGTKFELDGCRIWIEITEASEGAESRKLVEINDLLERLRIDQTPEDAKLWRIS